MFSVIMRSAASVFTKQIYQTYLVASKCSRFFTGDVLHLPIRQFDGLNELLYIYIYIYIYIYHTSVDSVLTWLFTVSGTANIYYRVGSCIGLSCCAQVLGGQLRQYVQVDERTAGTYTVTCN